MNIDYSFKNILLLKKALSHPSIGDKIVNYERMEFLGDAILKCILSEYIYNKYSNYSEGKLSRILSNIINTKAIAIIGISLGIHEYINMSFGEIVSKGKNNPKNLENVTEALIAAIFLDSDYYTTKLKVKKWWEKFFISIENLSNKDNKTTLQEIIQKTYKILPKYNLEKQEGNTNSPTFTISIFIKYVGKIIATGRNKKQAEQLAASKVIEYIKYNIFD